MAPPSGELEGEKSTLLALGSTRGRRNPRSLDGGDGAAGLIPALRGVPANSAYAYGTDGNAQSPGGYDATVPRCGHSAFHGAPRYAAGNMLRIAQCSKTQHSTLFLGGGSGRLGTPSFAAGASWQAFTGGLLTYHMLVKSCDYLCNSSSVVDRPAYSRTTPRCCCRYPSLRQCLLSMALLWITFAGFFHGPAPFLPVAWSTAGTCLVALATVTLVVTSLTDPGIVPRVRNDATTAPCHPVCASFTCARL
jgi:hypothetical protein